MNFFLLLISMALIATCTCQEGFYNLDDSMNAIEECVWHTICDLDRPLELKPTMDAIPDESMEHFMQGVLPTVPEKHKEMFTVDNIRSVEMWEEQARSIFCVGKDEEEEREACSDKERIRECDCLNECVGLLQVFNAKMTEEGECNVQGVNFDAVDSVGKKVPGMKF